MKKLLLGSLVLTLVAMAISATLAGWDMYPTNVIRILAEACFPREEVIEDAIVPFENRSEIAIETTDVDVEFALGQDVNLHSELKGRITAIAEEAKHLSVDSGEIVTTLRTKEQPDSYWRAPFAVRGLASEAKLKVTLPKTFSGTIRVKTRSGAVTIEKASLSEFAVKTQGGRVNLLDTDIHVVKIASSSGAVTMDTKAQEVSVETVTGPIEAKLREGAEAAHESLVFESKSGAVRIAVREDASLSVTLESLSGHATSALALGGKTETHDNRIVGDLGSAHGTLSVRTWTGDLSLEKLDQ